MVAQFPDNPRRPQPLDPSRNREAAGTANRRDRRVLPAICPRYSRLDDEHRSTAEVQPSLRFLRRAARQSGRLARRAGLVKRFGNDRRREQHGEDDFRLRPSGGEDDV